MGERETGSSPYVHQGSCASASQTPARVGSSHLCAVSAILSFIIDLLKELCKNRSPTQAAILDRYGRICLCLDEVMGQVSIQCSTLPYNTVLFCTVMYTTVQCLQYSTALGLNGTVSPLRHQTSQAVTLEHPRSNGQALIECGQPPLHSCGSLSPARCCPGQKLNTCHLS